MGTSAHIIEKYTQVLNNCVFSYYLINIEAN